MTKKHFQLVADGIAAALADCATAHHTAGVHLSAATLANQFEAAFPRFDREKFLVACGVWDA